MTKGGEIEFLDAVDAVVAGPAAGPETLVRNASLWRRLALGAVLAVGAWFVMSPDADAPQETPASPEVEPAADEAPFLDRAPTDRTVSDTAPVVEPPDFGVWPSPPRERDPSVVRTVGSPPLPPEFSAYTLASTTLVYVATSGLPTVVSFETGDVSTVEVAATRVHETFAVHAGQVVSADEAALAQAFVFHTYRDVDRPGVGTVSERGVGFGPELCLSGQTCARPGLGPDQQRQGSFIVERFDARRHVLVDELLTSWDRVDGALLGPNGYRMPEPVGLVWVISQTSGGSVSSSGLL